MYIILLLILIILLLIYERKKKQYWLEKGVYSPPDQLFFGSVFLIFSSTPFWKSLDILYKKAKGYKMFGQFELFSPKLVITDPTLIKNILVKDFDHFADRRQVISSHPKDKISQEMVTVLTGERWKSVRSVVTRAFSSGKIKAMFPLIEKETEKLKEFCHSEMLDGKSINMMELSGKYSFNVIQNCAFGMEGESFKETPSEIFHLMKDIITLSYFAIMKFLILMLSPKIFHLLGMTVTPIGQAKLTEHMKRVVTHRRLSPSPRKDFLTCMMEAEKEGKEIQDGTCVIDDDVIVAQSVLFMFAGFQMVQNNLSFIMYNIAKYPEEQDKLRLELRQVENDDGIDYQKLQELHYLDAFISETMRMFPSAFVLERSCTKDYNIPNTDIIIPKDMIVVVPTYSLHYDPELWDEPEQCRPSRFLKENRNQINNYAYLPFGLGPRNCLGNRFVLMEMKMAVAKLLLSFDIKLKPGSVFNMASSKFEFKPDNESVVLILNEL